MDTHFGFDTAIRLLKEGHRVARAGWNGKGMWIALSPGNPALPCITMKTATGEILMGWLASQTDMLAEDWEVVS